MANLQKIEDCPRCGGRCVLGDYVEYACTYCQGTGKVAYGLVWVRGAVGVTLEDLRKLIEFEDYKAFVECTQKGCAEKKCQNQNT